MQLFPSTISDEDYDFQMEQAERPVSPTERACRALISSIISQAVFDALNPRLGRDCRTARMFIDAANYSFTYYCELIDLDPEWVVKKMKKAIKERSDRRELTNYDRE